VLGMTILGMDLVLDLHPAQRGLADMRRHLESTSPDCCWCVLGSASTHWK
jgi:hypothetical protein